MAAKKLKVGDIVERDGKRYRVEMVGDPNHDMPEGRETYGVPVDERGRVLSEREIKLTGSHKNPVSDTEGLVDVSTASTAALTALLKQSRAERAALASADFPHDNIDADIAEIHAELARRGPKGNPASVNDSIVMPEAEHINEAFVALARRNKRVERPVTLDQIRDFIEYVHAALVAIPVGVSEPRDADGLTATQRQLWCEWAQAYGTMVWMDDEMMQGGGGHPDVDRRNVEIGKLLLNIPRARASSMRLIDEPATVPHRFVPKDKWDDMIASGLWAYPRTAKDAVPTRRRRWGPGSANENLQLPGLWRFIGRWHPSWTSETDAKRWLPAAFRGR